VASQKHGGRFRQRLGHLAEIAAHSRSKIYGVPDLRLAWEAIQTQSYVFVASCVEAIEALYIGLTIGVVGSRCGSVDAQPATIRKSSFSLSFALSCFPREDLFAMALWREAAKYSIYY
jgi:hypothetical protein